MAIPTTKQVLAKLFDEVDTNKNGTISSNELKIAMQKSSVGSFDDQTARMMVGMFDKNHNGAIDSDEFAKLFQFQDKWITRFFNGDHEGAVNRNQFVDVLKALGYFLSPKAVDDLMSKYARDCDGKVRLSEFMKCGVLLNALDSAYRNRDTEQGREITISFEDLLMVVITKILL